MTSPAPRADLRRAFLVLFKKEPEQLQELSETPFGEALRRAYRRAVLENHPDRARALGADANQLQARLLRVNEAHGMLRGMPDWTSVAATLGVTTLAPRATAPGPKMSRQRRRPARQATWAEHPPTPPDPRKVARPTHPAQTSRHTGPLPARPLRFAEYLYYAGWISHRTLVEAVVWQRMKRPRIGQLAVDLGYVTRERLQSLVAERIRDGKSQTPLAEYAWQCGVLTRTQAAALVARQRKIQPAIGRFFVEAGLLDDAAVDSVVRLQRVHAGKTAA